jgi:thiol-disulfide isomerase/thioredoxin
MTAIRLFRRSALLTLYVSLLKKDQAFYITDVQNCPYCERAIPQLDKAAKELGVRIYYIDVNKSIADTQNESDKYIAALSSYLKSTFSKDENGDPAFYVPEAVGIKNGKITDYMVGLPLDYKMTDNNQMNGNQKKELYSKYKEIILKTAD